MVSEASSARATSSTCDRWTSATSAISRSCRISARDSSSGALRSSASQSTDSPSATDSNSLSRSSDSPAMPRGSSHAWPVRDESSNGTGGRKSPVPGHGLAVCVLARLTILRGTCDQVSDLSDATGLSVMALRRFLSARTTAIRAASAVGLPRAIAISS